MEEATHWLCQSINQHPFSRTCGRTLLSMTRLKTQGQKSGRILMKRLACAHAIITAAKARGKY